MMWGSKKAAESRAEWEAFEPDPDFDPEYELEGASDPNIVHILSDEDREMALDIAQKFLKGQGGLTLKSLTAVNRTITSFTIDNEARVLKSMRDFVTTVAGAYVPLMRRGKYKIVLRPFKADTDEAVTLSEKQRGMIPFFMEDSERVAKETADALEKAFTREDGTDTWLSLIHI